MSVFYTNVLPEPAHWSWLDWQPTTWQYLHGQLGMQYGEQCSLSKMHKIRFKVILCLLFLVLLHCLKQFLT